MPPVPVAAVDPAELDCVSLKIARTEDMQAFVIAVTDAFHDIAHLSFPRCELLQDLAWKAVSFVLRHEVAFRELFQVDRRRDFRMRTRRTNARSFRSIVNVLAATCLVFATRCFLQRKRQIAKHPALRMQAVRQRVASIR